MPSTMPPAHSMRTEREIAFSTIILSNSLSDSLQQGASWATVLFFVINDAQYLMSAIEKTVYSSERFMKSFALLSVNADHC
jgi:hypothetical protein